MDASEPRLDELAGAILDGTSVDWRTIHSTAGETERSLVEELRVLATLADFHREQRADAEPGHPPETWGHIRVLEALGSGAFGRVYRAWDTRLDREVALKLLPARSDHGDAHASSVIDEGRLLARVHHPNVVTIYGAERIGDTVGLWMELIDGETVEQRLARCLPFQPSETIEIGIQICRAVSAVHDAGLLHRDIKTQNVMLATGGRAVLMDFGTGWEMSDASASTVALAGTPLYLAPELLPAAATPRFRAMYTASACCSIACSPEPIRYAPATSRICAWPTNVATGAMSLRFDVMCRDGWPPSSTVRPIPMPSAGSRASTNSPPRLETSSLAERSFRSNTRSRSRSHSWSAVCCCRAERCARATRLWRHMQDYRGPPWHEVAPMARRLPSFR